MLYYEFVSSIASAKLGLQGCKNEVRTPVDLGIIPPDVGHCCTKHLMGICQEVFLTYVG